MTNTTAPPGGRRKAPRTTTPRGLSKTDKPHSNFSAAPDAAQVADGVRPLSKYELLWLVPMPAARKLVAMAMAYHSDPDGGSIYPSYTTLGWMTDMKPLQVGRHIKELRAMGVVICTKDAAQHYPAHYAINLDVLSDLAKKMGLAHSRLALKDRSETYKRLQTHLLSTPDPSFKPTYPLHPGEEEERAGPGSPASPGPGLPDWWPMDEWQVLTTSRPRHKVWLGEMLAKAIALHGQGAKPVDIAEQFLFLAENIGCKELRVKTQPSASASVNEFTKGWGR